MSRQIQVFSDAQPLAQAAVQTWSELAKTAINARGGFHVALSGGSTPKKLYTLLAEQCDPALLSKTHFYFGDERSVAPDHKDSNFRMAQQALFAPANIDEAHIHRMQGELPADEAAGNYQKILDHNLPKDEQGMGVFDLVLLGMGEDGHTASLFPGTDALTQTTQWVCANHVKKLDTWRITLTYPLINNADNVLILVSGAGKQPVLKQIFDHIPGHEHYPIEDIHPRGNLLWYLDQAAANDIIHL